RTLKNLGEAPVIYDHERSKKSVVRLRNYYFNQGYFNTRVLFELDTLQYKKAAASYKITTGKPYTYDSLSIAILSPELDSLYKTNKRASVIKKGAQYNATHLDEERDRITSFF